jgi:hypothetical protein
LHGDAHQFPFEVKVKATGIDPAWNVPVEKLWGWIKSRWPGQRYMKLLTQLAVSKAEYVNMERHAMKIWEA